jgi:hypothetical protein
MVFTGIQNALIITFALTNFRYSSKPIIMKISILSIALFFSFSFGYAQAQDCSDLFFSEYVEGSGNNKTLEIYNPTGTAIDLSTYEIKRYSNGSPVPTETLTLSGTIQPFSAVVVTNGQTDSVWVAGGGYWSLPIADELYGLGDLHCSGDYPTPMYFNGNDAMTLETITGVVVDIFGKYGDDPGNNGWNDIPPTYTAGDQWWTSWSKDNTLIRKPGVKKGVTENPVLFKINEEWDSIPKDVFDSLRFHTCDCEVLGIGEKINVQSIAIYPNPLTGSSVTVDASMDVTKLELVNLIGQVIWETAIGLPSRQVQVDLPSDLEGIYLLRVYFTDSRSAMQKLVIR